MGCLHAAAKATEAAATEATEAATAAPCRIAGRPMQGVGLAKATTKLTAQERVILFCLATGISHTAVGIGDHIARHIEPFLALATFRHRLSPPLDREGLGAMSGSGGP